MIRNADHLMAEAIQVVAGLYKDGTLQKPKNYSYAFPNLLLSAQKRAYLLDQQPQHSGCICLRVNVDVS